MGKAFEIKLNKNLERDVGRMAQGHIAKLAKDGTRAAERVHASHAGKPVHVVKPIFHREMKRAGSDMEEPDLTYYAQQISDGVHVIIKPGPIW